MSLRGEYRATSGNPDFIYNVNYQETNRTSDSVGYKVTVKIRMGHSSSWYGYGISSELNINGATVAKRIKNPSPNWSGSGWQGTWEYWITAPAGTGGGTLPAQLKFWGTDGGSAPNITIGGKTVAVSTWNTAPTWDGNTSNMDDLFQDAIIPENTDRVQVNWNAGVDREGNRLYYYVYRYVNGQQVATIQDGVEAVNCIDYIGQYGQGDVIQYKIRVRDSDWLWVSEDRWTWSYTKNSLLGGYLEMNDDINYSTDRIAVRFSGAHNTNGNTSLTYKIFGDVAVYNATVRENFFITIVRSGETPPSTPYILYDDLVRWVQGNNYVRACAFRLETTNAYGSTHNSWDNITVNMITPPNNVSVTVSGDLNVANGKYFIPELSDIYINWTIAYCSLGTSLTYTIQRSINNGDWVTIHTGIPQSQLSIASPKYPVSAKTLCKFRVIAISEVSSSYSEGSNIELHYYQPPVITVSSENRTANELMANIVTRSNSSIPAITIKDRSFTNLSGTTTPFASDNYNMTITGLTEEQTGTVVIKATDNSGLAGSTTTYNLSVSSYIPIVSIRKLGLGISDFATNAYKLAVKGASRFIGKIDLFGALWVQDTLSVDGVTTLNSGADIIGDLSWTTNGDVIKLYPEADGTATSLILETSDDGNQDSFKIRNRHWEQGSVDVAVFERDFIGLNAGSKVNGYFGQFAGMITDFNEALFEGEYGVSSVMLNSPEGSNIMYGKLVVKVSNGEWHNNTNNWIWQIFYGTSGNHYMRNKSNSADWSEWQPILGNKQTSPLWTGAVWLNETQSVTPTKPLRQCLNGWLLVWSDFDAEPDWVARDWNWTYTFISKSDYASGMNSVISVATGEGVAPHTKGITFHDSYFSGHTKNDEGGGADVVLRNVYEW